MSNVGVTRNAADSMIMPVSRDFSQNFKSEGNSNELVIFLDVSSLLYEIIERRTRVNQGLGEKFKCYKIWQKMWQKMLTMLHSHQPSDASNPAWLTIQQ